MRMHASFLFVLATLYVGCAHAEDRSWIDASNAQAQILLDVITKYNPESAAALGVEGHDGEVMDLEPRYVERQEADTDAAIGKLQVARSSAADPRVQQDIDILIDAAQRQRDTLAVNQKLMLPYFDLTRTLFQSFHALLDERVSKQRQAAAVQRLRRYVGAERGYEPITTLARARIQERLNDSSLTGPWNVELEQDLENQDRYLHGIQDLFKKSGLTGWQKDFKTLQGEVEAQSKWLRVNVMPRARKTNRLPPEIYANNLKSVGVTMDPHELMERALFSYVQTRDELASLARVLAAQRGWKAASYQDVIREMKKDRIPDDRLLEFYKNRLGQIEDIVRREKLVTLPTRPAVIRLGTEAESTSQPAPHLDVPRLVGNTGEPANFILPTSNPNAEPGAVMDDFKYDGIAWTLTAHEARPGHELQFAKMMEHGVSTARAVFAFNSANVEGWALYAEAMMKPYMPLEGQVGVLQLRMMRAARAFLDPMLNLGMIEPDRAKRLLMEEVALSEPMAKQEVDRYTFRAPGQATSYFFGYTQLETLRARAEFALEDNFHPGEYHDFLVNEGLLPLNLLAKAVMERFVPEHSKH